MPVTIQQLGIDQLSVRDRLDLIDQIWDSLPEQVLADEVPAWHLTKIQKRRADAGASPSIAELWRDVLDKIPAKR